MYLQTQRFTHRKSEVTVAGGRDSWGVRDGHGHTAAFNMKNPQGPAGQHTELCSILCNHLMVPRGKGGGRDSQGVWDGHGHTAAFNIENQQGPAQGTLLNVMWQPGWEGSFGVCVDTCICMAESLCCPPETIATLFIGYQFSSVQ